MSVGRLSRNIDNENVGATVEPELRIARADAARNKKVRPFYHEVAVIETPSVYRGHHDGAEKGDPDLSRVVVSRESAVCVRPADPVDIVRRVRENKMERFT